MSNIAQKIIDQNSYVVELVTTKNEKGEKIFAYLLMPADTLAIFRQKLKSEIINLNDYGIVIASGFGHSPSEEAKKIVLEKFPEAKV